MFRIVLLKIGYIVSPIEVIIRKISVLKSIIYTGMIKYKFKSFGMNSIIEYRPRLLKGLRHISIGKKTYIGHFAQLTAWDKYKSQLFTPSIIIGDNCSIGDYSHITCINAIRIGNNVLTGKNILITDNSHGATISDIQNIPPVDRSLYSKGPVIIEDNVWIGEKASILPGVRVGFGAIIGAGSVVTKNVPAKAVVGGNPASVLKIIE